MMIPEKLFKFDGKLNIGKNEDQSQVIMKIVLIFIA